MKNTNNTKDNKIKLDELGRGEFFFFNENLYMKIMQPSVEYYLAFVKPKSCSISKTIEAIYEQAKEWNSQTDLSMVPHTFGLNAFNLTNNCLAYIRGDIPVTPVKGAVTIENE